jgi:uncharacterized protein
VLRETAKRGHIYVGDGGSQRSLASQIAGANNVVFAQGWRGHRLGARTAEVDRALTRLDSIARERGAAVGWLAPAGLDRAHRQMGESRRKPRYPAGADHRSGPKAKSS